MFNKLLPGQLYVATSRVGSPDNICFAVKKAPPGSHPFLTPNVVYREILLSSQGYDDMSMLSDDSIFAKQMVTPPAGSTDDVYNVDTPRDTDYEHPYSGMCLGEEQDDGGPDHTPTEHHWPRLKVAQTWGQILTLIAAPSPILKTFSHYLQALTLTLCLAPMS